MLSVCSPIPPHEHRLLHRHAQSYSRCNGNVLRGGEKSCILQKQKGRGSAHAFPEESIHRDSTASQCRLTVCDTILSMCMKCIPLLIGCGAECRSAVCVCVCGRETPSVCRVYAPSWFMFVCLSARSIKVSSSHIGKWLTSVNQPVGPFLLLLVHPVINCHIFFYSLEWVGRRPETRYPNVLHHVLIMGNF